MVEGFGTLLLRSAADDAAACRTPAAAPGMADTVVGFHAQQACEKCLKVVLGHAAIDYPRTHDLLRLMQLLRENGIELPADTQWIDELMPYAVNARYGVVGIGGLDRDRALAAVDALLAWARDEIRTAAPPPTPSSP